MKPAACSVAALLIAFSAGASDATAQDTAGDRDGSEALHQLFTDEQAFTWKEDPLTASYDGVRTYEDRLSSDRPADFERRAAANAEFLKRLHAIDRAQLSGEDQISYDLFEFILTYRVKFAAYREWRAPLNSDSGFHTSVMQMHEAADTRSVAGYERYVARLEWLLRTGREGEALRL